MRSHFLHHIALALTTQLITTTIAAVPNPSTVPHNFGMVLFPAWEALDVMGPLGIINHLAGNYTINLSLLNHDLNPVSTKGLLPNLMNSTSRESIVPTHTFDTAPDDIEVLIVPGGGGTRGLQRPGHEAPIIAALDFIEKTYPKLKYLITVCTGSALVAMTGILDGKRATTNKQAWKWATAQGPNVKWVPRARWVVDGNIWTSSGVSAGIDVTFAFITEIYGEELAEELANRTEYIRNMDKDNDPFAVVIDQTVNGK